MRQGKRRRENEKFIKDIEAEISAIERKIAANTSEFIRAHYRAQLADALSRRELEKKQ
jgi:hypothetical protein